MISIVFPVLFIFQQNRHIRCDSNAVVRSCVNPAAPIAELSFVLVGLWVLLRRALGSSDRAWKQNRKNGVLFVLTMLGAFLEGIWYHVLSDILKVSEFSLQ